MTLDDIIEASFDPKIARQRRKQKPGFTPDISTKPTGGVYYHGTTVRRANKITRQGLRTDMKAQYSDTRKGHVYVSNSPSVAARFAVNNQGDHRAAIVRMHIPHRIAKHFQPEGNKFKPPVAFASPHPIHAKYMQGVLRVSNKWNRRR